MSPRSYENNLLIECDQIISLTEQRMSYHLAACLNNF
ncbi:unnamed protein product [Spirodela intermedia]|uniref:Uncharacterized protein n=1 Tax=Spirodela intermedia TaxID=51605 RepID=A0A7I8IVH3_SPIIN|nr:unnamed protein product [Spirodela intermedia]CAA6661779.1 unnamed protein product [Spirodela intermedia]